MAGIHWRPEHGAYIAGSDDNGDLDHVVSVTTRGDNNVALASFTWPKLEEYLAVSNSSLVRMFDFTLLRHEAFSHWPDGPEAMIEASPTLFYRQKKAGEAAYTRGVQIILTVSVEPPKRSLTTSRRVVGVAARKSNTLSLLRTTGAIYALRRFRPIEKRQQTISTHTTTLCRSSCHLHFSDQEVLSKYKSDHEKYRISERGIECRAAWNLRGYEFVNEAGQIHAYICDLRALPYSEQLHWLSFNEEPKTGISERAFTNDFKGEFVTFQHPREVIISIMRWWDQDQVHWWTLRDDDLLHRRESSH